MSSWKAPRYSCHCLVVGYADTDSVLQAVALASIIAETVSQAFCFRSSIPYLFTSLGRHKYCRLVSVSWNFSQHTGEPSEILLNWLCSCLIQAQRCHSALQAGIILLKISVWKPQWCVASHLWYRLWPSHSSIAAHMDSFPAEVEKRGHAVAELCLFQAVLEGSTAHLHADLQSAMVPTYRIQS